MIKVMTTMTVPNFEQWKTGFEFGLAARQAAGAQDSITYRSEHNPNQLTVIFEWEDAEKATAFINSPVLLDIQKKLGISDSKSFLLTGLN
jgi:heme-degrading monooxygenase HmoA